MDFRRIAQRIHELFPAGFPDVILQAKFENAEEEGGEFVDEFVLALKNAGIDLGLNLAPSPVRTQFTELAPQMQQATAEQFIFIGHQVALGIVADAELQARFARWRELNDSNATDPNSHEYDPELDNEFGDLILELDDRVSALELSAHDKLQESSNTAFDYHNHSQVHSLPIYIFTLYLLENEHLHELVEFYKVSSGFLTQWMDQEGNVDIEVSYQGERIPFSVPREYAHFNGAVLEPNTSNEEIPQVGETFAPNADQIDRQAEDARNAGQNPPAIDLTNTPVEPPEGEGYQALDPEILNPKPTSNNAEEFKVPELPGYEVTPYVEKLSEAGGALPASTERFANPSPRESAERMLSKFIRAHGSIQMIEPSVHVSEFGETIRYWPQVFSSDALPELGFFEAHFGYLSEFPVKLPNGEVEMMDIAELKATLQHYEGANAYFGLTPVVPGMVPMAFTPVVAPVVAPSPTFIPGFGGFAPVL